MRTVLRTAVATALVAGVVLTTPAFTAGAAFAVDGPMAVNPAESTPAKAKPTPTTPADAAKGTLVRTETLMHGTIAKIYKVNAQHHRAELFHQGNPVGVLDAITRAVAGNDNGEFFVLFPEGRTLNWDRAYLPGADPGMYKLADGTVMELAEKDGRLGLQLVENGKGRGFTYLTELRQVWVYGNAVVVLEHDGGFAAYIQGSSKQAAPQPYVPAGNGQPEAPSSCTAESVVSIGAGTKATLTMSPKGPKAEFSVAGDEGDEKVFQTLDRVHPALPKSAGIVARIVAPYSSTPSLYTKVEGGTAKGSTHAFPKLPKGCTLDPVEGGTSDGTSTDGTQTTVVPKGGVAAGAETGSVESANDTALMASGLGAASVVAAGLGFVAFRRRTAGARG